MLESTLSLLLLDDMDHCNIFILFYLVIEKLSVHVKLIGCSTGLQFLWVEFGSCEA